MVIGNGTLAAYAEELTTTTGTFDSESIEFTFEDAEDFSLSLNNTPQVLSNFGDGAYYYYTCLDDNNYAVYEALSEWVTPSEDMVTVSLEDTISVTVSGLPGSSSYTEEDAAAFSEAVFGGCKSAIDCLLFDYPEIFWLETSNLAIGVGSDTSYTYSNSKKTYTLKIKSLTFTPAIISSYGDLETAMEYKDKLDTAIEEFNVEGDTLYDQLMSIHDQIAVFTYYDENADFASSAVGALLEPGVVCEGYSKAFKLICDRLNVPCALIFGNYDVSTNVAHMWNYVQMEDGNWYAIDLTWDDLDGNYGAELKYQYFLKGSDSFFSNHTEVAEFNGTSLVYPVIQSDDYDPYGTIGDIITTTTTTTTTINTETTTTTTPTCTVPLPVSTTTTTTPVPTETTTTTTSTCTEPLPTTTTTTTCTEPVPKTTTTTTTTITLPFPTTTSTTTTCTEPIPTPIPTTTTTEPVVTTTTTDNVIPPQTTSSVTEPLNGDYNNDGEVNVADLVICASNLVGRTSDVECDFNGDSSFNVFDLILLRRFILYV